MADVTLPSLGESVTEGIITRWFKKVGDTVARDEALFEVSTDKVDSEMPSPAAGVLTQILAQEGDTVQTGARVAVIDENATAGAPAASTPDVPAESAPTPDSSTPTPVAPAVGDASGPGVVISPVVRRILADGGVEASTVTGTGPGGSITRRDAERAVALGPTEEIDVPLSNGRLRMAQHMSMSSATTPHGFVAVEVDVRVLDDVDQLGRVTRDGVAITDEMVVSLAAVRALAEYEHLNASFAGDHITLHRSVNLGLQRTIEPDGMLVPVVHAAAGLTLRALARRVTDLDARVASRQLSTDDLLGGTFTIAQAPTSNVLYSAGLIIQPEVAVLSLGAARHAPVVVEGAKGPELTIGRRMVLGLSFDHRVIEPAMAAAYLERVGELLAGMDIESEH